MQLFSTIHSIQNRTVHQKPCFSLFVYSVVCTELCIYWVGMWVFFGDQSIFFVNIQKDPFVWWIFRYRKKRNSSQKYFELFECNDEFLELGTEFDEYIKWMNSARASLIQVGLLHSDTFRWKIFRLEFSLGSRYHIVEIVLHTINTESCNWERKQSRILLFRWLFRCWCCHSFQSSSQYFISANRYD